MASERLLLALLLILLIICLSVMFIDMTGDLAPVPGSEPVWLISLTRPRRPEKHNDDSQNAHDPVIRKHLRLKYEKLLELDAPPEGTGLSPEELLQLRCDAALKEIENLAQTKAKAAPERYDARKISCFTARVREGHSIHSLTSDPEGVSEHVLLTLVWSRIHHPANSDHTHQMEKVLLKQMMDGVSESYIPVCINGRAARMLSTLTLLDADPVLAAPEKDKAELANTAYLKAHAILENCLKTWETTANKTARELYETPREKLSAEEIHTVDTIIAKCHKRIAEEIAEEYHEFVDKKELAKIIRNAQAGIA